MNSVCCCHNGSCCFTEVNINSNNNKKDHREYLLLKLEALDHAALNATFAGFYVCSLWSSLTEL